MDIDLSKPLHAIAERVQNELAERLATGRALGGGEVAPLKLRGFGDERAPHTPGVLSGDMLRAISDHAGIRVTAKGFRVYPTDPAMARRFFIYCAGQPKRNPPQLPRDVGGIEDETEADAAQLLADAMVEQLVRGVQEELDSA